MNMDFSRNHPLLDYVNKFCTDLNIKFIDNKLSSAINYIFRAEASDVRVVSIILLYLNN